VDIEAQPQHDLVGHGAAVEIRSAAGEPAGLAPEMRAADTAEARQGHRDDQTDDEQDDRDLEHRETARSAHGTAKPRAGADRRRTDAGRKRHANRVDHVMACTLWPGYC